MQVGEGDLVNGEDGPHLDLSTMAFVPMWGRIAYKPALRLVARPQSSMSDDNMVHVTEARAIRDT
jgi:hypothetical protein